MSKRRDKSAKRTSPLKNKKKAYKNTNRTLPSLGKLRKEILNYFKERAKKPLNHKQVAAGLPFEAPLPSGIVEEMLESLADDKLLERAGRGKYLFVPHSNTVTGTFVRRSNGKNSLIPEDGGEPIRVAERMSGHAMDGDTVVIQLHAKRRGSEPEGEVIKILERKEANFVGTLSINNNVAFLLTESSMLANDIFIPDRSLKGAKDGDKVLVRVVEWAEKAKNPMGEVLDVLGTAGDNDTEMHAILAEYGLPYKYPEEVEEAANRIDEQSAYAPEYKREDFRDRATFTIDPKEAKDFDDALSVRSLEGGDYEIGVHIADVTAYVKEDDIIDREAQKRATSVYLVDRTVPMLPERLCNDLCSLRPDVDRPAYSVIFTLSSEGEVKQYRITRTTIHSRARLAYEDAQAIIEGGDGPCKEEILICNTLAQKMRTRRMEAGAIDFERTEMKFEIDENGKPISVKVVESKEANKLIEEFMLLANRTVAEHIGAVKPGRQTPPFVYRVHDTPDPEKLQTLAEFVMKFSYKLRYTGKPMVIAKSINQLLDAVQGKREENLIEVVTIRTMAKAVYQTDNIGHYGLAFPYYTHFTSPIRRHPDMMVHRLLTHYLARGKSVDRNHLEKACEHDSKMEQTASKAERSSIKYKQVEYMQDKVGQTFDGVISGITDWGLYVELKENGCEGLVHIRNLDDDYYEFDEQNYCLEGFNTHKKYSLGDSVTIVVVNTDLEKRQMDFELA